MILCILLDLHRWQCKCEIQRPGFDLPGAPGSGLQHTFLLAKPSHTHPAPVAHGPVLAAVPWRWPLPGAAAAAEQPQLLTAANHHPRAEGPAGLDRPPVPEVQEGLQTCGSGAGVTGVGEAGAGAAGCAGGAAPGWGQGVS